MTRTYDTVVIGSGPNGLAAAITMAQSDLSVLVIEGAETIGGGTRTEELTLPGFSHDVCAAVHPLGIASPLFQSLPLEKYGLKWIQPTYPLAHGLGPHHSVYVSRSLEETALRLGKDEDFYRNLIKPWVEDWDRISPNLLRPLLSHKIPSLIAMRRGLTGLRSARGVTNRFRTLAGQALFGGAAAHAFRPLDSAGTAVFGLILLALAHRSGWPFTAGGSQAITNAMAAYFGELGGEIQTGRWIESFYQLPSSRVVLADIGPHQFVRMSAAQLQEKYQKGYHRFRYGPAAFKIDYALSSPLPWLDQELARAGTIHLGGKMGEMIHSERRVWEGEDPTTPFVLVAQPSCFDQSRVAGEGHTLWVYAHIPHASQTNYVDLIENWIDRFAPGFREVVLAKSVRGPVEWEKYNPNLIGGDIGGGANTLKQLLFRPRVGLKPYQTPLKGVFLCSASTPPGGGVHGMGGYNAAQAALRFLGVRSKESI